MRLGSRTSALVLAMVVAGGCTYRSGPPPQRAMSFVNGRPVTPVAPGVQDVAAEAHSPRPAPSLGAASIYLPGSQRRQDVRYQVIGGLAVFEGDIVLGPAAQVPFRYAMPRVAPTAPNVYGAAAIAKDSYLWPGAVIPYEIDMSVTPEHRGFITWAVGEMEGSALKLRPRTPADKDYVVFTELGGDYGCSSHVGRIGGAQEIWVKGCGVQGSVVHEIMHAGGFYHEQSREDRDAHVTIAFDEIDPAHRQWFEVRTGSRLLGPYDYSSIMHYSRKAFSRRGQDTIIPKVPGATIGQREGLSDLDKAALAQLYGNASPPGPPTGPPTGPPSGPPPTGFSGSYTSQRGDVTCSESGGSVSCSFPGGSMVCAVQGANLDCGWLGGGLGGGQGRAVFNRQSNGTLAGTYGDFLSHDSRGAWDLVPSGQPGAPPGQPPAPPPGLNIPGLPPITLPPVPSGLPAIPGLTPPTQ